MSTATINIDGMTCASCVSHVQKAAMKLLGVEECQVNLARGRAVVSYDAGRVTPQQVASAISDSGYAATPEASGLAAGEAEDQHLHHQRAHADAWRRRAIVGIALWLPVELAHWILQATMHGHSMAVHLDMDWVSLLTSTLAIVYVGKAFFTSAWKALLHRTSNMDTLIALGAGVAYGYSLIAFGGFLLGRWGMPHDLYFMEATGLLALISLGHWLEARARDLAGSAIRQLMELAPAIALRLDDHDQPQETPVAQLERGDRVLVRPGDRVPIDGVVTDGRSDVDESMITGEPIPVLRTTGDGVIGGTLNQDGRLIVRATRVGGETALAQIVKLVDSAQSAKPPVQQLADRVAAIFVPTVLGIALVTGAGWWMWGHAHGWSDGATWGALAKAVCSVLIIACPCALGLALPAAMMVGTGRGARRGILVRDIDALQMAEQIKIVVLDKTGTVTIGKPVVTDVIPVEEVTREELLRLAAAAEQYSEHPLAKAIVAAAREQKLTLQDLANFKSQPGGGVIAEVDGMTVLVGNDAFVGGIAGNIAPPANASGQSQVHVGLRDPGGDTKRLGVITLADRIKPDSAAAIAELHGMGLRTVLLTGDTAASAEAVAKQAGIQDVRAQVKPDQKAQAIMSLQQQGQKNTRVAMVGDGINDAPALAQADLGIAIGSGSDIAKETGGIVLVSGSLRDISAAIRLSRATMRTIRQNLFLAFAYNVLAIPLAAFGLLNPLIAAAAMALSDITVVGNALLLRRANIDGEAARRHPLPIPSADEERLAGDPAGIIR